MRKILTVLLALLLLSAATVQADPPDMANYVPESTTIFFSTRADDAFVDELDSLLQLALADAPPTLQQQIPPLNTLLNLPVLPGLSASSVLAVTGDHVAVGLYAGDTTDSPVVVMEVSDRDGMIALLDNNLPQDYVRNDTDNAAVYVSQPNDLRVTVTDNLLTVTLLEETDYLATGTLADNTDYQTMVSELPDGDYNMLLYTNATLQPDQPGILMVGFNILDEQTLVIDTTALLDEASDIQTIDPAFTDQIPAGTSAVIQASDLSSSIELALQTLENENPQNVQMLRSALQQQVGISLEEDVIPWTTGDYALYVRVDASELLQETLALINDPMTDDTVALQGLLDAGLIIEATDPAAARNLAERLGEFVTTSVENAGIPFITVATEERFNITLTDIVIDIPETPPLAPYRLTVSIGANDTLFFIATNPADLTTFSGEPGMTTDAAYQEAMQYALPNPISLAYGDGEGVLLGTAAPILGVLAALGPVIGDIFEEIIDGLEAENGDLQAPATRQTIQFEQSQQPSVEAIGEWVLSLLSSGSISANVTESGNIVARFALTISD